MLIANGGPVLGKLRDPAQAAGHRDGVHFNFMVEAYAKVPFDFLGTCVFQGYRRVYLEYTIGYTWVCHVSFSSHVIKSNSGK